jgi:hypothetical protein
MSIVPPSHREGLRNVSDSFEKIAQRIKIRQDSPANWLKNDPVLESGEFGYEIGYPTGKLKIGTGSTRWSELPYLLSRGQAGQPGAPGPAGPPGKGIQIKGVADVWPPPGTPEVGDLWVLDDPIPPTAPAGSSPGDGFSWTGTKWVATGPIQGPEGKPGDAVAVFQGATAPTANNAGDMWLKPGSTPGETTLNIWDGAKWVAVASGGGGNVDLSEYIRQGDNANLSSLSIGDSLEVQGVAQLQGLYVYQDFYYGGYVGPLRADEPPGYVLPTPTAQGYLRSDLAPDSGWYFAEPVVVSDTQPPTPPGDPALPMLWINPTGTAPPDPNLPFSDTNPPVYSSTAITQQPNGLPIGLSADGLEIHQPLMVGGVPVLINGKKYLLPVIEASPSLTANPLFVFEDPLTRQQLDGTIIGEDPTGMLITQPYMVGGVPVVVNGIKYLLPLIEV